MRKQIDLASTAAFITAPNSPEIKISRRAVEWRAVERSEMSHGKVQTTEEQPPNLIAKVHNAALKEV